MIGGTVGDMLFGMAAVALVVARFRSRRAFLLVAGFLVPMIALGTRVFVNLFWMNLVGPVALLLAAVRRNRSPRLGARGPALLLLYAAVLSGVWMVLEYGYLGRATWAHAIGLFGAQAEWKMPVQLFSFAFMVSSFYVAPLHAVDREDARGAVVGLLAGLVCSVAIGFGLLLVGGDGVLGDERTIAVEAGNGAFGRLGGMSGEPKMLGAFLVPAILYCLAAYATEVRGLTSRRWLALTAFLTAGLFATYSTSAWLAFAAGLVTLLATFIAERVRFRAGVVPIVLAAGLGLGLTTAGRDLLEARVGRRVLDEDAELHETKNWYVVDAFREKPAVLPIGFGLGGLDLEAGRFVLRDSKYRAQTLYVRTPTPSVTLMRLAGDLGLVGLAILLAMVVSWRRLVRRLGAKRVVALTTAVPVAVMAGSWNGLGCAMFLMGAVLAEEARGARGGKHQPSRRQSIESSP